MWACYCYYCKDNIVFYTTRKPVLGDVLFYGDFYHKDFTPVRDIFDEPMCNNCGRHFPSKMIMCISECEKVFDFTQLA